MELNTRSRVMILNVVVLAGGLLLSVASYGAETEKPEKAERPDLPLKVKVGVPPAVREDMVKQVVDLCRQVWPKAPRKWFQAQYQHYVRAPLWSVFHNAWGEGWAGPIVQFRGTPSVHVSFPAARPRRSLLWEKSAPPPGYKAEEVELDEALRTAQAALSRLVPREADRRDLALVKKTLVHSMYWFDWAAPVAPGHVDRRGVTLWVPAKTGVVSYCRVNLRERPPVPVAPCRRARIEKHLGKLDRGFRRERLRLFVAYGLSGPRLRWRYASPAASEGFERTTLWDAATGDLVWSNAYDGRGQRLTAGTRPWTHPKAYPWRTKKEVVERLEEMAAERAKELTGKEPEEPAEDE